MACDKLMATFHFLVCLFVVVVVCWLTVGDTDTVFVRKHRDVEKPEGGEAVGTVSPKAGENGG